MKLFRVTILSACCVAGKPIDAGAEIELTLQDAATLIAAGRAAMLDVDGAAELRAAWDDELQRHARAPTAWGQTPEAAQEQLVELHRIARPNPIGFIW